MIELISIALTLLIVVSWVWVYFDATRNKIGKVGDDIGIFNMHAGAWAIATIGLWIIAFPAYLIKRKSLIEKAKLNPVEPVGRQIKLVALDAAAFGVVVLIILGVANTGFGPSYEIEEIQDRMNGNKLKVTKQEVSADGNFVSDIALVCESKGKNIHMEVTSFFPPDKNKKLNPAPLKTATAGGELRINVPVGKIKFGELNPLSFEQLVGSIKMQEYNNQFSWDISQERLLSTLVGLTKLGMASKQKSSPGGLAPEEQEILDKLASEEAAIKADEKHISLLQSQQPQNETLDDEGSNVVTKDFSEKMAQLAERKKVFDELKASAASVEQKMTALKASAQADIAKLNELNKRGEDVIAQLVGSEKASNFGESIGKLMVEGVFIMLAGVRIVSDDTSELIEPAMSSKSGSEFVEKLGQEILIEYKTENGVVQTEFVLDNRSVRKVLDACR